MRAPGWLRWFRRVQGMQELRQRYGELYRIACVAGLPLFSRRLDRALLTRAPELWRSRLLPALWSVAAGAPLLGLIGWFSAEGELPVPDAPLPPPLAIDDQCAYVALLAGLAWVWAVTRYPGNTVGWPARTRALGLHVLAGTAATLVPLLVFQAALDGRVAGLFTPAQVAQAQAFQATRYFGCELPPGLPAADRDDLASRPCPASSARGEEVLDRYRDWVAAVRNQQQRRAHAWPAVLVPFDSVAYRIGFAACVLLVAFLACRSGGGVRDRSRRGIPPHRIRTTTAGRSGQPGEVPRPRALDRWLLLHHPGAWAASPHRHLAALVTVCLLAAASPLARFAAPPGTSLEEAATLAVIGTCAMVALLLITLDLAGASRAARLAGAPGWTCLDGMRHFSSFRRWVVACGMGWPLTLGLVLWWKLSPQSRHVWISDAEGALDVALLPVFLLADACVVRLALVIWGRLGALAVLLASLPLGSMLVEGYSMALHIDASADNNLVAVAVILALHGLAAAGLARLPARSPGAIRELQVWLAWSCLSLAPAALCLQAGFAVLVAAGGYDKFRDHHLLSALMAWVMPALAVATVLALVLEIGPAVRVLVRARATPQD